METNGTSVVSLTSHKISSQAKIELDGVRRSLPILQWDLQTQQILFFAGLQVSEAALAEDVPVAVGSHASQLGHASLKDLVTRSEEDGGLAMCWSEFSGKVTALVNRQKYSIHERDYHEINALVDDATTILGRKPLDVGEFHSAKQKALEDQLSAIQRESETRNQHLNEKNINLMRSLTDAQADNALLRDSTHRMLQETEDQIAAMKHEMVMKERAFEYAADERLKAEAARIENEFNHKLMARQTEMDMKLHEADIARAEAQIRMGALQARIDSGELVSAEMIEHVNASLSEAREAEAALRTQMLHMNASLTESQKQTQALREENTALQTQVGELNQQLESLEARTQQILEDKLGSSEYAVLHERISYMREQKEGLEARCAELTLLTDKQGRTLNELRGRFQEMRHVGREHLRTLHDQVRAASEKNGYLEQSLGQTRIMIALLGIITISAVGAMLGSAMGYL